MGAEDIRYLKREVYMDLAHAHFYRWRCDRASAPETSAGQGVENVVGYEKRRIVVTRPEPGRATAPAPADGGHGSTPGVSLAAAEEDLGH